MNGGAPLGEAQEMSLDEQSLVLRRELQAQRDVLAGRLAADRAPPGSFPRSLTLRWLVGQPALAVFAVKWLLGRRRHAFALAAVIILARRWAASRETPAIGRAPPA